MDEQRAWVKSRRKKRLRMLAVTLVFCLLFTTYPDILETLSALAAGTQSGDGTVYISGFAELPEEVREQTVPVGTEAEGLTLPDTLEAFVTVEENTSGETEPAPEEDSDDPDRKEEGTVSGAGMDTETGTEGTDGETGDETGTEGTDEETGDGTGTEENGSDSTDNNGGSTDNDGDNTDPAQGDNQTEESGDSTDTDQEGTTPDTTEETGETPAEEIEDTEGQAEEQDTRQEESAPEETDAEEEVQGESAPSVQTEDAKFTQETHTVTMPEYQAENVITVETLENTQETGTKEETVMIEGVTWQSAPEYDGNTEGTYLFTAVLPEDYALMEGVGLPQITVTVQADSADSVIQALLERIAALPDAEEYLAKEPDAEEEEAYVEWMEGLYEYAGEALDIQEAYDALTGEQQAQIPEEAFTKLAAWAEIAEQVAGNSMVMAATTESGTCGDNLTWILDDMGTLTISGSGAMSNYTRYSYSSGGAPWSKEKIKKVVIESGVTSIGKYAFYACGNLSEVTIPDSVTSIGDSVFESCSALTAVTIPDKVTEIKSYTFSGCSALAEVTIPNSVTVIGGYAFESCSALTAVTIPDQVTEIKSNTFSGCSALAEVTIPDSVKMIGQNAFENCSALTAVTIPDQVTEIGTQAFYGCSAMTEMTFQGTDTIPELRANSLPNSLPLKKISIRIPSCRYLAEYSKTYGWQSYKIYIVNKHTPTKVSAKAATCDETGNTEHWKCNNEDCGLLFSDSEGKNPTTEADVTILQLGHRYTYTASDSAITHECTTAGGCGYSATAKLSLSSTSSTYTGQPLTPASINYTGGKWKGTTPTIGYENNTNVGTATAYIEVSEKRATVNFTITKANPTYNAPTAKTLTYNRNAQELVNAGSTSGGTMQYSLNSSSGFSTTIPKGTNAGSYTVYYKVVGDSNHNNSATKPITVTIGKASINPAVTMSSWTFGGTAQNPSVRGNPGGGSVTYQYKVSTAADSEYTTAKPSSAGTYTVKATIPATTNYNDGTATADFTISKANSTVTTKPTANTLTYNGSAQALVNAGSATGGTMQYSLSSSSGFGTDIPTGTDAKNYTVYYKVKGDSNHNDSVVGSVTVTINKATPTVTAPRAKTLTYNGSAQALVIEGSTTGGTMQYSLNSSSGFSNAIPKGTDAKTYTVYYKVVGNSNYNDVAAKSVSVTISPKDIDFTSSGYSGIYDGKDHGITVTATGATVTYGTSEGNCTLTSSPKYKNVGSYTVYYKVTRQNYKTVISSRAVTITARSISGATISDITDKTYTGSEIKPTVTVKDGETTLALGTDYTVTYSNNTNKGTAKVTVTGNGNYTGAIEKTFLITANPLTAGMVTLAQTSFSYTGDAITPAVTVKDGTKTLTSGTDYDVSYSNNINVGAATVTVTGKGNYSGAITKNFTITTADISSATVTLSSNTLTYDGSAQTPSVSSVEVGGRMLIQGTDYTVSDNRGTNVGEYKITITGKDGYAGSTKEVTYAIEPRSLTGSTVTFAPGPHYYTGSAIEPAVTVKNGDKTLEKDKDYTVSYENNVNVGTDTDTATVKITGQGNYKDTISETFTIEYRQLPSKSLTDYVTISPEPNGDGWYNTDITLTPKDGYGVGETHTGIGSSAVTISDETGTDGVTKTIYIKDGGNIYQTEFPYKLDQTPPAVDLTGMTVENGTKGLWNWIIGKKSMIIKIPDSCIKETLSGIAEVSYTATPESGGAGKSGTIDAKNDTYEIALNEEFTGTIQLTVKDKAGNTTQVTLPAENGRVIAEDSAPVVTFALPDTPKPNENGWYNTTVTITVTVTDDKDKDSGSTDIISGGIAKISWKDGESGTAQTVADLPGNDAPVYKKEFTIQVTGDGTHTYYVNAADNAGNESGWQTVTVEVDTEKPDFSRNLTVTNLTKEGADITFTPSEGGKAYWIVSDTGTVPTAQEVKEQGVQNGGVQDIVGGTGDSFTITGLSAGEKHTVYVVLEDAAGNLSEVKTESFLTLQEAPEITLEQLTVDYTKETIKMPDHFRDVEVYTDPQHPESSRINKNPEDGSLPVKPGTAVYIRYPEKSDGSLKTPASDGVKIDIPDRPAVPEAKQAMVTDTTAAVTNPVSGEEYILVKKGKTPDGSDWGNANTTGQFTGLAPNKEYDLYVRKKATGNSFASDPVKTEIRTHVTIKEPVIEGDAEGKSGNTASKPAASAAGGTTVTYTGTYSEEYTPVIKTGSQEIIPGDGTADSEMTWDENSKKGSWEYTCPIPNDAAEVEITVEFRKRSLTGVTVTPDTLTIYADDAANVNMEALKDYVKANSSVNAAYDNKTSGAVEADYTITDSFEPKGRVYSYIISAGGKAVNATLTVNTVSAAATDPDKYMQVQKNGGYTAAEVGEWLPAEVTVTYTGAGYTARTENRAVTWSMASIGSGFGAAIGAETITGTVDLPVWAAEGNSVSMVIEFVDKTVLRDDQIQLTVPDFSYGAQTLPNPKGGITVTDTNPVYTYLYSTDGGTTWVTANQLPKSDSGYIIPGGYMVKMTYTGDRYTGEKTASFTVGKNALTVLPGTLAVQNKNYDGTTNASLKEGGQPALSGVAAGDTVTPGGSLSAVFTGKGPKKNIPVTVTGFALEGEEAGYYTLKNTTLTLYATINNADGTPPDNGGNGGNNGGGDSDDNDNSSNTPGDNNDSATPAVTPTPVTPPSDTPQPASGTNTNPDKNGGTQPTPENSKGDAEPGNTDRTGQDSTDPAQTEGEASQTLQAPIDSGKLTIAGDPVTTGNITEASETTTILEAGDGTVIVTVVCEEESCTAGVKDTVAVANAVLAPEQIGLVNDGETIEIRVDVKDISETVPGQDQEVIESGLAECRKEMPDLALGMYVDISMFIKVGEGDWNAVTSTAEPIEVVIGIPEDLKGDGREFSIIRSHDGEYTLLPDIDDNPDTITISTNLFSAYAIAYEQADRAEVSVPGESGTKCGLCHICPTFLGICYFIWLAVIVAVFLLIWVVIWRKRQEEVK